MHNWAEFRSARIHAYMHTCSTTSGLGHKKRNIFRPPKPPKAVVFARKTESVCTASVQRREKPTGSDATIRVETTRLGSETLRQPDGRTYSPTQLASPSLHADMLPEKPEDQAGGDGRPPCCAASSPCRQANSPEHKRKDSMRGQHSRRDPPPLATIPPTIPPPAVGVAWRHGAVDSLTHHADAVGSPAGDD